MVTFIRYLGLVLTLLLPTFGHSDTDNKTYKVATLKSDFVTRVIFESLANEYNYHLIYQEYDEFDEVINSIASQENDLTANIIYSPERAKNFQISSPTNTINAYFFNLSINFKNARVVGVPKNSIYLELIPTYYPNIAIVEYSTADEAISLTNRNKIDGFIEPLYMLKHYLNEGFRSELLNDKLPIPPAALGASFNVDMAELEKMATFIQSREQQIKLRKLIDTNELKYRQEGLRQKANNLGVDLSKPIKIALEPHAPLVYYDENNELTGITTDILKEICTLLDANCQFMDSSESSWQQRFNQLKTGQIDVLAPVVMPQEQNDESYFSAPYFISNVVVVKRDGYQPNAHSNLSELIMERVGVVKDGNFQDIISRALPNKELVTYNSVKKKIQGLINGEVDYILINDFDYHLTMKNSNNSLPIQVDTFFNQTYIAEDVFAFSKSEKGKNLTYLFNLALDIINTKPIIAKHDVTPDWLLIVQTQQQGKRITYAFFIVILLLISAFVYTIHRRSVIDELTKLKNRRALYAKYGTKGIKAKLGLIYFDVNSFKMINDTHGHHIGDQVLIEFAQRIKQYWQYDAYRIGGDEFILIGPLDYKEQLLENITHFNLKIESLSLDICSSPGIYLSESETVSLDEAIHQADMMMYEHKKRHYERRKSTNDRRLEQVEA